ncbi:hypothetical protein [Planococcus dechangensis]|uniref:DUF695 domain-containing protein n=1 Tax=Planococcus dechangensis TaxID=1176255 RepID=A0A4D6FRG9_9BACL|nr:hypothetical protein [Planococcus dechangensis]
MGWFGNRKNKFDSFWNWFVENEHTYYELGEQNREKEMNVLYNRLQKVNKHFAYEFSHELIDGKREFILSADGMVEAFDDLLDLYDSAPELERFKIIAFRQPNADEFTVTFGDVELSRDDVYFEIVDEINKDVVFYIKGFTETKEDEYIAACFILLDGVIGEFYVGTKLGTLSFEALKDGQTHIPVSELADVLKLDEELEV